MRIKKTRTNLRCEADCLVAYAHPEVEDTLRAWARPVAEVSPLPPRVSGPGITCWSSWYNLYATIAGEILLEHLNAAARICSATTPIEWCWTPKPASRSSPGTYLASSAGTSVRRIITSSFALPGRD
jgi:hypothetical protein